MEQATVGRPAAGSTPAAARLRWAGRGAWAVADQGLFALANFGVAVLLARWLPPADYGAFTVAYSLFLLVGTVHTALLTEPMLVFGAARYEGRFAGYLRVLLGGHWLVSGAGAALLALGGLWSWATGSAAVGRALWSVAAATPFVLLAWLARRACFTRLRPAWAAAGGALYLVLSLAAAYLLFRTRHLSASSALAVLGGASLVTGAWLLWRLRGATAGGADEVPGQGVRRDHWTYGRWALASSALSWVPANVYLVALPALGGLEAGAALKALLNLVMPLLQAIAALATLLLPALVRQRESPGFDRLVAGAAALFVGAGLAYWVLVGLVAEPLLHWLYRGQYTQYAGVIWLVGALPVAVGVVGVLGSALRALERPDLVFRAYAASALAAVSLGLWAAVRWGVSGAVVGTLLSSTVTAAVLLYFLRGRAMARPAVAGSER